MQNVYRSRILACEHPAAKCSHGVPRFSKLPWRSWLVGAGRGGIPGLGQIVCLPKQAAAGPVDKFL